jgi:hypothetical protein
VLVMVEQIQAEEVEELEPEDRMEMVDLVL